MKHKLDNCQKKKTQQQPNTFLRKQRADGDTKKPEITQDTIFDIFFPTFSLDGAKANGWLAGLSAPNEVLLSPNWGWLQKPLPPPPQSFSSAPPCWHSGSCASTASAAPSSTSRAGARAHSSRGDKPTRSEAARNSAAVALGRGCLGRASNCTNIPRVHGTAN